MRKVYEITVAEGTNPKMLHTTTTVLSYKIYEHFRDAKRDFEIIVDAINEEMTRCKERHLPKFILILTAEDYEIVFEIDVKTSKRMMSDEMLYAFKDDAHQYRISIAERMLW